MWWLERCTWVYFSQIIRCLQGMRTYLCVFENVMRPLTLRDDSNTLLHMVPQQHLGEHHCYRQWTYNT